VSDPFSRNASSTSHCSTVGSRTSASYARSTASARRPRPPEKAGACVKDLRLAPWRSAVGRRRSRFSSRLVGRRSPARRGLSRFTGRGDGSRAPRSSVSR
jgi:hypothetical protein